MDSHLPSLNESHGRFLELFVIFEKGILPFLVGKFLLLQISVLENLANHLHVGHTEMVNADRKKEIASTTQVRMSQTEYYLRDNACTYQRLASWVLRETNTCQPRNEEKKDPWPSSGV